MKDVSGKKVVVAGDGRHDSMGHSAKYCAYTLFNCMSAKIFHFSLVQVLYYIKDNKEAMQAYFHIYSTKIFLKQ